MKGVGAMLGALTNDKTAAAAYSGALGKVIKNVELDPARGDGGSLILRFTDDTAIEVWDDGRSCCESRYITTDDDLGAFAGAVFNDIELRDGPDTTDEYGEPHEIQFVYVNTSLGTFTLETHNIHNGYYGGFWVRVRPFAEATQTDTGPTPPAFDDADATTAQSSITCDLCGFSDFTSKKVTDDDAEDEELAQLEYVRYTCRNCGHQWHEAV